MLKAWASTKKSTN